MLRVLSGNGSSTDDELYFGRSAAGSLEFAKVAIVDDLSGEIDGDVATHAALTETHGATGAIVGTTNTQALTNKTLSGNTNTLSIQDNKFTLFDNADATKQVQFDLANISAGTTRVLILPNVTAVEIVATTAAQTLTNKTLTAPTLNDAILGNTVETTGSAPALTVAGTMGDAASGTINGNDTVFEVAITANGAGLAAGTYFTVTFAAARPDTNYDVWIQENSAGTLTLGRVRFTNRTTSGFDVAGTGVPVAATAYTWALFCVER